MMYFAAHWGASRRDRRPNGKGGRMARLYSDFPYAWKSATGSRRAAMRLWSSESELPPMKLFTLLRIEKAQGR